MEIFPESESDVTYGQVWWPILGISALHLPIQSAHTQQWTHILYIHSPHLQFLLARDSNSQPFDYESNPLTIRPRLTPHYIPHDKKRYHAFWPEAMV